jgi:hypothetical protein
MDSADYIEPGLLIRIVVDVDEKKGTTDVRGSMVYDVDGKQLIIAQTDPPIQESRLNHTVVVAYLVKERNDQIRYGFYARISGLKKDYTLSSMQTVDAVELARQSNPERHSLRLSYRVQPPSYAGMEMFIYGQKVNILDISLGGARISHNKPPAFEKRSMVTVVLAIDGTDYEVDAMIARKWEPENERFHNTLEIVALEFAAMKIGLTNILSKKIFNIQRELRHREVFGR